MLQFFPKEIKKDETYDIILKINEIEKSSKNNLKSDNNSNQISLIKKKRKMNLFGNKEKNTNKSNNYSDKTLFEKFNFKEKDIEIIKKFYKVFPLPDKKCSGLNTSKIKNKHLTDDSDICKINFFDTNNRTLLKIAKIENKSNDLSEDFNNLKDANKNNNLSNDNFVNIVVNKNMGENRILHNNSGLIDYKKNQNENKLKYLKSLFMENEIFKKKFDLLNENIHEKFKISFEDYVNYLVFSQEKELFENFSYPDMEFTFIYSNAFKTNAVISADFSQKKEKVLKDIPGDKTIHAISSIYPGLNWLLLNIIDPVKYPYDKGIHFVEFCAKVNQTNKNKEDNIDFIQGQNQYIPIKCECMDQGEKLKKNNCNHSAIINDRYLINILSDILLKGKKAEIYKSEDTTFKELYEEVFNDNMFCENFRELYKEKNSNENIQKKGSFKKRKRNSVSKIFDYIFR